MDFGTAFHTFVLERDKFNEQFYVTAPVLLKDVGRLEYDTYKKLLAEATLHKTILSSDEYDVLGMMYQSLYNNKQARELIENATYESSYFWTDEHSGLQVKARPDILHDNMIVDLKTCVSASSRAYQKAMIDGGYHLQGAVIREGIKQLTGRDITTVINICCEKTYPYSVAIKIIYEAGHMKFKQALLDIKRCIEYNEWLDYEPEIVDLPTWAT